MKSKMIRLGLVAFIVSCRLMFADGLNLYSLAGFGSADHI
jgi:hypothetical protein